MKTKNIEIISVKKRGFILKKNQYDKKIKIKKSFYYYILIDYLFLFNIFIS